MTQPPSMPLNFIAPAQLPEAALQVMNHKAALSPTNSFLLAILAGAFIAFAAEGSNMAAFNLLGKPETYGLGKMVAGLVFPTGLMLVLVAGAELFTGNTMMLISVLQRQVSVGKMLGNWAVVYLGNLIGALLVAYMMSHSGLFNSGDNHLGGMTIKIASYKTHLPFESAFYLGLMANWLVCLAVWMSYAARDVTGKLLAAFFPIWLFITSGFEHSIANMYYIPAGIMALDNPAWVTASGVAPDKLAGLNWGTFVVNNLLPVTLGNIVGGALFVAGAYWFAYRPRPAGEA